MIGYCQTNGAVMKFLFVYEAFSFETFQPYIN
jgi:hypothetical protein